MRIFRCRSVATLSFKRQLNRKGAKNAKENSKIYEIDAHPTGANRIVVNPMISLRTSLNSAYFLVRLCGKELLLQGLIFLSVLLLSTADALAGVADPHPKLSLSLSLGKNEAYPGESVPVTVTLRINDATVRNIGYPRLAAPDGKTIVFAPPFQESEVSDPGVILQRFTGQISGVKLGTLVVGPARLDCEVMKSAAGSAAFFGGQEPEAVQLTSAAATFVVQSLPASGKPDHFSGAVGVFSLSVTSLPAHIAPGEPLTVTTTIRGDGLLVGAACPNITGSDLQSFPVQATRSASQIVCEQAVVPNIEMQFPPVVWSFFDPQKRQYRVLSADIDSRVVSRPPDPQSAAASSTTPDAAASSQKMLASSDHLLMILVAVFGLIVVVAFVVRKRKKPASEAVLPNDLSEVKRIMLAAEEAALNKDVELFYNIAFEAVLCVEKTYDRHPDTGENDKREKRLVLNKSSHAWHIANEIGVLTATCDKVRYGGILPDVGDMVADYERLKQVCGY
ncbi:MAG: hypothetical protein PHF56_00915 [Desulfuromonadaceae bacterium]|nr:hypothetical protein [Desulfuromonadaceae bacterium]